MIAASGKQPYFGFPAETQVMLAQFFVQTRAEWYFAVLAALAFANVDALHRFVDVGNLKVDDLGAPCAGAVGGHEQGAMIWRVGCIDEPIDFLDAQHQRQ